MPTRLTYFQASPHFADHAATPLKNHRFGQSVCSLRVEEKDLLKKFEMRHLSFVIAGALVVMASCAVPEIDSQQESYGKLDAATDSLSSSSLPCGVAVDPNTIVQPAMTQTIYVPIYSQVYERAESFIVDLTVTLSIRNTDLEQHITLSAVCKYNTTGQLVEQYLKGPVVLGPLASRHYIVEQKDTRGGVGASFIVKWRSDTQVNQPVVEAVMISQKSQRGLSFLTHGHIIEQKDFEH